MITISHQITTTVPNLDQVRTCWRHDMETSFTFMDFCLGNPPVTVGFLPLDIDVFFVVSLNKLLKALELLVIWNAMTLFGFTVIQF